MKKIAVALGLLVAAAAAVAVLQPSGAGAVDPPASADSVTVSGQGVVLAVPDRAEISAGVETRAATARAALQANATAMERVLQALRAGGGTDVTTQTVSLSTSFDNQGTPERIRRLEHRVRHGRVRQGGQPDRRARSRPARTPSTARLRPARTRTRSIDRRSRRPSPTQPSAPPCSPRPPVASSGASRRSPSREPRPSRCSRRRPQTHRRRSSRGRRRRPPASPSSTSCADSGTVGAAPRLPQCH